MSAPRSPAAILNALVYYKNKDKEPAVKKPTQLIEEAPPATIPQSPKSSKSALNTIQQFGRGFKGLNFASDADTDATSSKNDSEKKNDSEAEQHHPTPRG